MTSCRLWQDLTTTDFDQLDPERTVALLPVGAIEQHGPHLPLATDTVIAEEIAKRAIALCPADLPVLLLPTTAVGKSNEHIDFAGTLTHSAETLMHMWFELGESVHRAGIRKLVFLNSHGGQPQVMEIVARDLRIKHQMLVVASGWWHMGLPDNIVAADEIRHGIHGGTIETSMMLFLRPDLVRMDRAENFVSLTAKIDGDYEVLRYLGGPAIGWQAQDLHPDGVAGDATAATKEIGERIVAHVTKRFATLLAETARHPLHHIEER